MAAIMIQCITACQISYKFGEVLEYAQPREYDSYIAIMEVPEVFEAVLLTMAEYFDLTLTFA